MPLGITFKSKALDNNLWLAGVEHDEDNINKIDQHENENQEMDMDDIHKIMYNPYEFHIPNQKHEPSIQEEQYEITPQIESKSIENTTRCQDNDYTHDYNEVDEYIMNKSFEKPENKSSNMGIKEKKLSTRNHLNYTIEEFSNPYIYQN